MDVEDALQRQRAFSTDPQLSQRLYRTLFEANVVGVTLTGEDELYDANDAFLQMVGYTRDDLARGLRWTDLSAPESRPVDRAAMEWLKRDGVAPPFEKEYIRRDGSRVPVLLSGTRVQEDPLLVLATIYDLSERRAVEREIQAALERERHAGERTARLQEITAGLAAARSPAQIARVAVNHAIEALSASAGLLAQLDGAQVEVIHAVGYDRDMIERWTHFPLVAGTPIADAILRAEPVVIESPEQFGELYPHVADEGTEHGSRVAAPLQVADRALGAIALSFRRARHLSAEDLGLLLAICRLSGTALERAQLFENRAYVASKLQEGLLPRRIADIPGMEAAVRYESIAGGGEVGGDFYDLFEAGPARWALVVGDVSGKGTEAAVVTGLARHTLRAIALLREDPAEMLGFLNAALRRHDDDPAFCTVGCGVIRPGEDGFDLTLAAGGHPYPLVLRAGGTVEQVTISGTMLGVVDDPRLENVSLRLHAGDALIVHTDGVIDARRPGGERFGDERLWAALASARGLDAEGIASAIESAVRAHGPATPADDRAIVVLRAVS